MAVDGFQPFEIVIEVDHRGPVLRVAGELDLAAAPILRSAVDALDDPVHVTIDVTGLTFADMAGLAPILELATRLRPRGQVRLLGVRPDLKRVLQLVRLDEVLGIEDGARP